MNKNLFTMIATVASSAFQASIKPQPPGLEAMMYSDPVLAGAFIVSNRFSRDIPNLNDLVETILADEEFGLISPREGELDPMIFHLRGGFRLPGKEI